MLKSFIMMNNENKIKLSTQQESILLKHLELVNQYNKSINLTNINDLEEGKVLHIEDSYAPIPYILCNFTSKETENTICADIGSGAGFPGIPFAVITGFTTDLIETTTKKCNVLNSIIQEMKLNTIKVINDRVENVSINSFERYDIVTARALSSISSLVELASPLLKMDGILACYKSNSCDEEINNAKNACKEVGMQLIDVYNYELSNGIKRTVVIYKKVKESTMKLPRKLGMAQKRPIK